MYVYLPGREMSTSGYHSYVFTVIHLDARFNRPKYDCCVPTLLYADGPNKTEAYQMLNNVNVDSLKDLKSWVMGAIPNLVSSSAQEKYCK